MANDQEMIVTDFITPSSGNEYILVALQDCKFSLEEEIAEEEDAEKAWGFNKDVMVERHQSTTESAWRETELIQEKWCNLDFIKWMFRLKEYIFKERLSLKIYVTNYMSIISLIKISKFCYKAYFLSQLWAKGVQELVLSLAATLGPYLEL